MRFLNPAGDEEGLVTVRLLLEPLRDLANIFPVFVLFVGQATAPIAGRRLSIQLALGQFLNRLPEFLVLWIVDRSVFRLKFPADLSHNRKFIILKPNKLVPGHLTVLMTRRVKHLPHRSGPKTVLLKKLWHRYRARARLADVSRVVEHSARLRIKPIHERSS